MILMPWMTLERFRTSSEFVSFSCIVVLLEVISDLVSLCWLLPVGIDVVMLEYVGEKNVSAFPPKFPVTDRYRHVSVRFFPFSYSRYSRYRFRFRLSRFRFRPVEEIRKRKRLGCFPARSRPFSSLRDA